MIVSRRPYSASSRVRIYPQDPAVSEPAEESIPSDSIGSRLNGPRMGIVTGRGEFKASADKAGNYFYAPSSKRFNQVQAFVSAQKTLDLFQGYADRPIPWAFDSQKLGVIPHAGEGKNAYYARWNQSIAFYSFKSRDLGKTVHVAQSADVVSHETGHAILDGMKPEWGKTFDRETKATHEAFGDCAAMLLTVSRPQNRAAALAATAGDLRKDNRISSIAEEFGTAVRVANRDPNDDKPYLRNANNAFSYKPPEELPRSGSREELSSEPHSFCQVFTRAFYNAMVGVYESKLQSGSDADSALAEAGAVVGSALAKGITMSAPNRARFADIAKGMLRAEELGGGQYQEALEKAFLDSEILTPQDLADHRQPLPQGQPQQILARLGLEKAQLQRTVGDQGGHQTHEFLLTEESTNPQLLGWNGPVVTADVSGGVSLTYNSEGRLIHLSALAPDAAAEWSGMPDLQSALLSGEGTEDAQITPHASGFKVERLPVFKD